MATLLAHVRVKPGKEAAFEALAQALYEQTHAGEPGVVRYEYWRGQEPGLYYCLESFRDYLAFVNHQSSPHHAAAGAAFGDTIAEVRIEWLSPLQGASPLQATEPQAPPGGAPPGVQATAARFPVTMAPWWSR